VNLIDLLANPKFQQLAVVAAINGLVWYFILRGTRGPWRVLPLGFATVVVLAHHFIPSGSNSLFQPDTFLIGSIAFPTFLMTGALSEFVALKSARLLSCGRRGVWSGWADFIDLVVTCPVYLLASAVVARDLEKFELEPLINEAAVIWLALMPFAAIGWGVAALAWQFAKANSQQEAIP